MWKAIRGLSPFGRRTIEHWRICLRRSLFPRLLVEESADTAGFHWLPSSPAHYHADPFLFQYKEEVWLFFEDYAREAQRGRICCAPLDGNASAGSSLICLDRPYHLSYPLVFSHDGEVFMIPESRQNGSVELWRATHFPLAWTLERTLLRGSFVDTTPLFHRGHWYFFTTEVFPSGKGPRGTGLRGDRVGTLFLCDSLGGAWMRHPRSPISADPRFARSAGAIVKAGDRLLRPIQDCGERYGRRIYVEEILDLSPEEYRGSRLHSIEPDWEQGLAGAHTYGFCAGIEALDAVCLRGKSSILTSKSVETPLR